MIHWFTDLVSLAMNTVYQGDVRALVALFFVSSLTEMGMPFPFVIDGVVVVTSYQTGLLSLPVARVMLALLLGREFGSAIIYWLSRFGGQAFIGWLSRHFSPLSRGIDRVGTVIRRRAPLMVAIARLTPGLLTSSSIASGVTGIKYGYFVLGILLSSVIADGALVALGYLSGHGLEYLGFTPAAWMPVAALGVAILIVWFIRYLLKRRSR
jgi:membrane protein DedA with SNARE-associated domain